MPSFIIAFLIYAFLTYKTVQVQDKLLDLMYYKTAKILAHKGFILKRGEHFTKEEQNSFDALLMINDIIKFIPFINVVCAAMFSNLVVRKVTKRNYLENEKIYLSDEEKFNITGARNVHDLVMAVDKVRLRVMNKEKEKSFSTSYVSSGKLHLKGKLPDLSYTLSEVYKIATMLDKPFTIGKIGDDYLAFVGSNVENPIYTYPDNKVFVPLKDVDDSSKFKVYLINLEDLPDEKKNQVVEVIKNDRDIDSSDSEPNIKVFESTEERKLELTR